MKRHTKLFTVVMTLVLAFTMTFASISVNAATVKPKKLYLKATEYSDVAEPPNMMK